MDTGSVPPSPVDAVHTDAAHAQRTDEPAAKPAGSEKSLPATPPAKPAGTIRDKARGWFKGNTRRTERPTLTPARLAVITKDDGTIDFDRVTPDNLAKLKAAVTTPEAMKALGLVNDAGQVEKPRTWEGMTATVVDAVNMLAVQAAVNNWQLTPEMAQRLFVRADKSKMPDGRTTHEAVCTLTGKILDKRFPGGFGAYDEEISLLLILSGWTLAAVEDVKKLKAAAPAAAEPATSSPRIAVDNTKNDTAAAVN